MERKGWVVKEKLCGFSYNSCEIYRLLYMIGFSCSLCEKNENLII